MATDTEKEKVSIEVVPKDESETKVIEQNSTTAEIKDENASNGSVVHTELPELEKKIIEQIEYYFSDINLVRDKFLQNEIRNSEEGWVDLTTMLKFARLAKLTGDAKVIVDALKKSPNNLIEVSENGDKIRRNPEKPLPKFDGNFVKDLIAQSLYVKHIPSSATLDEIQEFFKKHITTGDGKINNIIMRSYQDKLANEKHFKGSIFVTFDSKENAQKFLDEYKDKSIKFNENSEENLLILWQREYHEQKKQDMRNKREKSKNGKIDNSGDKDPKSKKETFFELPVGALLKVSDIQDPISREDIREYLDSLKTEEEVVIDFIEFEKGESLAYVRYKGTDSANKVIKLMESKEVELKGVKVKFEVAVGEEEQTVLDKMKIDIFKRRQKLMNEKKGGKKFGKKGGRGQKRSRGGDFESKKKVKVEGD